MSTCNYLIQKSAWLAGAIFGAALMLQAPAAVAAPPEPAATDPNFEIDANAYDGSDPGDDWETVWKCKHAVGGEDGYNATDCGTLGGLNPELIDTTGIIHDHAPPGGMNPSIFTTGGSKDTRDVSDWRWKDGAVPDKDDIEHAYAAAYAYNDDLIMYIGADRYANDGDSMMGAWFFQEPVAPQPDGTFSGHHRDGDILWVARFSGGGTVAELAAYVWNEGSLSLPAADRVKGTNLYEVFSAEPGTSSYFDAGLYGATVNTSDTQSPWDYTPKSGTPGYFPYNSFMEGGINISAIFAQFGLQVPCFSTFLIESRSSTSVTAQLKDFVLGSLNTCKISVAKSCTNSVWNESTQNFTHTYSVRVTNDGNGTVTSVDLRDDAGTPSVPGDDIISNGIAVNLTQGQYADLPVYYVTDTLNPPTNTAYITAHFGAYAVAYGQDDATCNKVFLPKISVTKNCNTLVEDAGDRVVVKVNFSGQVCNTDLYDATTCPLCTNETLENITVNDSMAGAVTPGVTTLAPGACTSYSGSYYPASLSLVGSPPALSEAPKDQSYSDTVTAGGDGQNSSSHVQDMATATCRLCPTCEPCP
jgi:ribosomal protein L31E